MWLKHIHVTDVSMCSRETNFIFLSVFYTSRHHPIPVLSLRMAWKLLLPLGPTPPDPLPPQQISHGGTVSQKICRQLTSGQCFIARTFFSCPHKIRMQNVTALLFRLCNKLLGHDTVQLSLLHPLRTSVAYLYAGALRRPLDHC
jgi:hypothetical protein